MARKKTQALQSMTGYGFGKSGNTLVSVEVELRSVNGKVLTSSIRMPRDYLALEASLEAKVRRKLDRGSVQGVLRFTVLKNAAASVNHGVLEHYVKEWRRAEKKLGLPSEAPSMATLFSLPGVYNHSNQVSLRNSLIARLVSAAFDKALDSLIESRQKEGGALSRELMRLVRKLNQGLRSISRLAPRALKDAQLRLKRRLREIPAPSSVIDALDISAELSALSEKSDVREEAARLGIHFLRFGELLGTGGPCGRELDFLAQECHREITTLGNKSASSEISAIVVSMKLQISQLKEQIANVE